MPGSVQSAMIFLIETIFNLFIDLLLIRLVLVFVSANYFNPLTQLVAKCTDFVVKPLRKIIPNYKRIEIVSILLVMLLEVVKFLLLSSLSLQFPNLLGLIIIAFGDALKLLIQIFFYGILLQALLSWVQPHSPLNYSLNQFVSPIMRPIQRLIPPIGGFDLSPIPAMILLQLLLILLIQPLMSFGLGVAFA